MTFSEIRNFLILIIANASSSFSMDESTINDPTRVEIIKRYIQEENQNLEALKALKGIEDEKEVVPLLGELSKAKEESLKTLTQIIGESSPITPIFVLGCPRSGTTMICEYIGSSEIIYNFIEFSGFYLSLRIGPNYLKKVDAPYRENYDKDLFSHAVSFAVGMTRSDNKNNIAYVDSTPDNLRVIQDIIHNDKFKNAIFILMIRDYKGVIQSLKRSYEKDDRKWAGKDIPARVGIYKKFYRNIEHLKHLINTERLIVINYDELCEQAAPYIDNLDSKIPLVLKNDSIKFDREVLCESHATSKDRKCIGTNYDKMTGQCTFQSISSYNKEEWEAVPQGTRDEIENDLHFLTLLFKTFQQRILQDVIESSPMYGVDIGRPGDEKLLVY